MFFGKSGYWSIHGFWRVTVNWLLYARAAKRQLILLVWERPQLHHMQTVTNIKRILSANKRWLKNFGITSPSVVQETAAVDIKSVPLVAGTVNNLVNRNQAIMKAELLWTLKTVTSHCSCKSNENINDIFQAMFPDSAIAKGFCCGEHKMAYFCVWPCRTL